MPATNDISTIIPLCKENKIIVKPDPKPDLNKKCLVKHKKECGHMGIKQNECESKTVAGNQAKLTVLRGVTTPMYCQNAR